MKHRLERGLIPNFYRYNIPIPNPSTTPLSQLQATLSAQTDIPLKQLKLIHKGAVLKDASLTISSYGIKDGANLVLVGKDGDAIPNAPPPTTAAQSSSSAGGGKKKAKQPTTDSEQVLVDWINHSLVQATLDPLQASIATFLSYMRHSGGATAEGGEEEPQQHVNRPKAIPKFEVLQREHARLSELLLRGLLDFDSVDIPDGWQEARKARKEGVKRVQGELTKVDDAWGARDKLGG